MSTIMSETEKLPHSHVEIDGFGNASGVEVCPFHAVDGITPV
jgi:hypothetical protein